MRMYSSSVLMQDLTDTFKRRGYQKKKRKTFKANTETFDSKYSVKRLENDKLEVKVEKLKNENVASMVTFVRTVTPYAGNDEDVQYVRYGSRECSEQM